jgi:hypothetical protein
VRAPERLHVGPGHRRFHLVRAVVGEDEIEMSAPAQLALQRQRVNRGEVVGLLAKPLLVELLDGTSRTAGATNSVSRWPLGSTTRAGWNSNHACAAATLRVCPGRTSSNRISPCQPRHDVDRVETSQRTMARWYQVLLPQICDWF